MVVGIPRNVENNQIVEMQFFVDYNERRGLQAIFGILLRSSALAGPLPPSEDSATSKGRKVAAMLQRQLCIETGVSNDRILSEFSMSLSDRRDPKQF